MRFFSGNAQNKINDIINNCTTMDDCGNARKVIDEYESDKPKQKEFVKIARNTLCDKTYEVFADTRSDVGRY